ncbi:hypothetical protein M3686_09040 [Micrococcus luteus]|uniref:hypothetical protein n=1 Tax=Micrococcus luteus TaxID=1270 RepID=UPI0020415393|nr:hypothetical protein [Micrococcus luteus]MCM3578275.1 hypothetical protein [Micrococcus luteus]
MVDRHTLGVRSHVASALASWLTAPGELTETRRRYWDLLEEGQVTAVAAGPEESAALTIHRIERHGGPTVILATMLDDAPLIVALNLSDEVPEGRTRFDVPGGFTVREWVLRMQERPNEESFTAAGSEFAAVIGALAPLATA